MTPHVGMESALQEPGRSPGRFYRLIHGQDSSFCPLFGVAAPHCCCQCWCWLLVGRDCSPHPLWHSHLATIHDIQTNNNLLIFIPPPPPQTSFAWFLSAVGVPKKKRPRAGTCSSPALLGEMPVQGSRGSTEKREKGEKGQRRYQAGMDLVASTEERRKGTGQEGKKLFKEREAGWKHGKDKEHSCRESWGLSSGLGTDLSCSLWKVMSRSCLQCVLRSLECELSCLLLDSLFTKLGGPVLIFYSNSFCSGCGWTCWN